MFGVSIPFDQGNVFRHSRTIKKKGDPLSQSLSIRAMSFDNTNTQQKENIMSLNPFRSGQCLSTVEHGNDDFLPEQSQSLSIRAMSFDIVGLGSVLGDGSVSIPFDQGNVFRLLKACKEELENAVSIPFDQGNVFRLNVSHQD